MIEIQAFEKISLTGRIAYGIMCAEEYLTSKYPQKKWNIVFLEFWKITGLDLWDGWMESALEFIPEYCFEFENYESSDFEYLSQEQYEELKILYSNVDSDVNTILNMVYNLACSHAYSAIVGVGEESLEALNEIICFLEERGVALPDFDKVKNYSISEKNGWGFPFNGTALSKILK